MGKEKTVSTCLQCQEDELLGMRDNSREFLAVLGVLGDEYDVGNRKEGTTAAKIVSRLCKAEKDHRRLRGEMKARAARVCKEADELIAALRFVSTACNRESGSVHVGGGSIRVEMADLLNLAVDRIRMLVLSDRGMLEGRQPQNEVDFLADIWKAKVANENG